MVNKDKYTIDYNLQMDNADEKLLEEDILAPQDSKRYNLTFTIYYNINYISKNNTSGFCFV